MDFLSSINFLIINIHEVAKIRQVYKHVLGAREPQKIEDEMDKAVTHDRIVGMLREIGEVLGFFVRVEDGSPDGAYRYDVTWRDAEAHAPLKVLRLR